MFGLMLGSTVELLSNRKLYIESNLTIQFSIVTSTKVSENPLYQKITYTRNIENMILKIKLSIRITQQPKNQ